MVKPIYPNGKVRFYHPVNIIRSKMTTTSTGITKSGFQTLRQLIKMNPLAAQIYSELAPDIDSKGHIAISLDELAKRLDKKKSQVSAAQDYLNKQKIIHIFQLDSGSILHVFNPHHIFLITEDHENES